MELAEHMQSEPFFPILFKIGRNFNEKLDVSS